MNIEYGLASSMDGELCFSFLLHFVPCLFDLCHSIPERPQRNRKILEWGTIAARGLPESAVNCRFSMQNLNICRVERIDTNQATFLPVIGRTNHLTLYHGTGLMILCMTSSFPKESLRVSIAWEWP